MQFSSVLTFIIIVSLLTWIAGRSRALQVVAGKRSMLHSLPGHYGYYALIWSLLPALLIMAAWVSFSPRFITATLISELPAQVQSLPKTELNLYLNNVRNIAAGDTAVDSSDATLHLAVNRLIELEQENRVAQWVVSIASALLGLLIAWLRIGPKLKARDATERALLMILIACSLIAILTTVGIVLSVLFESLRFFESVSIFEFLFGLEWSPQTAIRADQVGSSGAFGAVPLFAGTLLISFIAMVVAVPLGLMSAIYLAEYASSRARSILKPLLEILAGIPTVVYGFFAALTVAPTIRGFGESMGFSVASESALAAGLVMGIMIIPFVSSLSDDIINAVPDSLRDGAYALGATQSETISQVILPAALPGIVGGILLAVSRAIGETMIVVMAAGLSANLTANPFQAVTTVTVQIVTLLVGDQEFDSPKTLAAFALGLMLFITTLLLNVLALHVVRKYREQYD